MSGVYYLYHFGLVVSLSEVLFLLFHSVFVCSICKFMRGFNHGSRWAMGI